MQDDAKFLSENFNLKLSNFAPDIVKCGFPCSCFDKYYNLFTENKINIKLIDQNTIFSGSDYLQNNKITNIINVIKQINIENTSISEAYAFIEKLKKLAEEL